MCSPCRAVCLQCGGEVVSPGWRDLVTLREELTCLVKGVCCQQMTGTGFMQIPAGRGGSLNFGKWQSFLKLPAWFNGDERVADKDMVPQVEKKKSPKDWKCFVWQIPHYSKEQHVNSTWKVLHNCRRVFFLSLILQSWKTSFFRLSVYYLDKQQNAATAITLMIKGL